MARQGIRTIQRDEVLHYECAGGSAGDPSLRTTIGSLYVADYYIGCQFDCRWGEGVCMEKDRARRVGKSWGYPDWFVDNIDEEWRNPLVLKDALGLLEKELEIKKPGRVLLSPRSDSYQPLESALQLTRALIERLTVQHRLPITVLTKGRNLPRRDFDLLVANESNWFGVTITEEDRAARDRGKLIQEAKAKGISTFVQITPWPPGTDAQHIMSSLQDSVDFWLVGSLIDKHGRTINPQFYEINLPLLQAWIEEQGMGDKVSFTEQLLRAARLRDVVSCEYGAFWGGLFEGLFKTFAYWLAPVSLLIISVDDLTFIRNKHGDSTADLILSEIASIVKGAIRGPDALTPLPNADMEQGYLVISQTSTEEALILGEKLCGLVEKHPFSNEEEFSVTVSVGIATYRQHGSDLNTLTENAQRALDQARAEGGNEVCTYGD